MLSAPRYGAATGVKVTVTRQLGPSGSSPELSDDGQSLPARRNPSPAVATPVILAGRWPLLVKVIVAVPDVPSAVRPKSTALMFGVSASWEFSWTAPSSQPVTLGCRRETPCW